MLRAHGSCPWSVKKNWQNSREFTLKPCESLFVTTAKEWVKTNRLSTRIWCKFASASSLMNIWVSGCPSSLKDMAFQNTYPKERHAGLIYGLVKIGKQITKNRCGAVLSQIKVPLTTNLLNKDRIRTLLKTTFYPHNLVPFNF